jgi:hypothetical protein
MKPTNIKIYIPLTGAIKWLWAWRKRRASKQALRVRAAARVYDWPEPMDESEADK